MAIPAQVRKQSEAVQKLYDDLNEDVTEQDVVSEAVVENIKPDPVEDTDSVEQQAVESTNNEQVKVDDVDEEETKPYMEKHQVRGFPHVVMTKPDGAEQVFAGNRTSDELLSFIEGN
mgnify:CR=1 FL=1